MAVQQHPDLARLYPRTTNTLRVLTACDEEPFIAGTALRIGRENSYPVDGWLRGGLSASVDLDTGVLGPGLSHPANTGKIERHSIHPESGAPITGTFMPNWSNIKTGILAVCRALPFLPYVGWDVVVTTDGFKILEGNHFPDVSLVQVHKPLLADERVRRFCRAHGVVR